MPRCRYEVNTTGGWRLQEFAAPVAVGGTFEADETDELIAGVEKGWLIRHGVPKAETAKGKGKGKKAATTTRTKREPQPPVVITPAPGVSIEATQPAESGVVGTLPPAPDATPTATETLVTETPRPARATEKKK